VLQIFLGSSIQACQATRRHILAFEEDKQIFDALIALVMRSIVLPKPAPAWPTGGPIDVDDDVVVPECVAKIARFSK